MHIVSLYELFGVRFLPRDALYCIGRYCDRMSSVCLSICPWRWWIRIT